MKRIINRLLLTFIIILFLTFNLSTVKATSDLDYINLYEVTVDPRIDGTLDIYIHINWQVLDDDTDGPLKWVKIGIPNKYVDEIEATTNNISKIKYYSDSGSFIRVDFDRKYYKDEIVDFSFKFHLSRIYKLNDDSCYYDYNPGWFDEIKIEKAIVRWRMDNINYINEYDYISDGYYVYEKNNLNYSETIKVKVNYPKESFVGLDKKLQYSSKSITTAEIITIVLFIALFIGSIVVIIVITEKNKDPYMQNRGFCGSRTFHYYGRTHYIYNTGVDKKGKVISNPDTIMHSTGSGGGHGSCACACACACAGGGRAGCSRKDFYNTNLQTDELKKVLDKELKK